MKKVILNIFVLVFIMSIELYCFDDVLEDAFDNFEDAAQLFGIIAVILVVMYFVKRFIREDFNYRDGFNGKKNLNGKDCKKIEYKEKDLNEYKRKYKAFLSFALYVFLHALNFFLINLIL